MSNPFAPSSQGYSYGGPGLFDSLSMFGQQSAPMSMEDQLAQSQINYYNAQPGIQQQQMDIAKMAAAPPSKWATGAQTFGSVAQGLAGLGSIYLGYQGLKEQKKEFKFNKEVTNTNLNNSILDYNRRLGDTLSNRALNNGQGQGWISNQLAQYSAKRG